MLHALKKCFSLSLVLTLVACATPYYDHSAKEWAALSEAEQAVIKAEYAEILKLREDQKHSDILDKRVEEIMRRGGYKRTYNTP